MVMPYILEAHGDIIRGIVQEQDSTTTTIRRIITPRHLVVLTIDLHGIIHLTEILHTVMDSETHL